VLVLAFDTSTPAVTVAVAEFEPPDGIRVLAHRLEVAANRHGELLAPSIAAALSDAGVAPKDLGAVGVGLGPGPFTGLRVGIVTARAMADALAIPVYGESSLRLIGPSHGGVATNARRKQVYWAILQGSHLVAGPDIASPEAAAARFAASEVAVVSGEGPLLYPEAFAAFTHDEDHVYPRAERLIELIAARVRSAAPSEGLTPMYLRRPDAQPPGRPKQVTPA
jgi:tRNA threonylcarbamoyl adenosine modification protein YeaZ